jgi:hypothetical protein
VFVNRRRVSPRLDSKAPEHGGRNFRRCAAKVPQQEKRFSGGLPKNPQKSGLVRLEDLGACLAPQLSEVLVFRAAVLSIALTLAVGPNAAVLCTAWCHPAETQDSACQHPDATLSPRVTGEDSCPTVAGTATAFVREEAGRGSATSGVPLSVPVPPFLSAAVPTDISRIRDRGTSFVVGSLPILSVLRI